MIGIDLRRQFLDALAQSQEDMVQLDLRKIYSALDHAAGLYVRETKGIKTSAQITTSAGSQSYDLPADFIEPCVRLAYGDLRRSVVVAKYTYDTDGLAWPHLVSYDKLFYCGGSEAVSVPRVFAIHPAATADAALTGSASADGALVSGEAVLTDAAATFTATVSARDVVINTSRNSSGIVLQVVSDTQVKCALFPEGLQSWRSGDGYLIQPEARLQVVMEAPSADSGHVFTLPYIAQPAPVYSDLGSWRLDDTAGRAIAYEAAYLYSISSPKAKAVAAHHQIFKDAVRAARNRLAQKALEGI